MVSEESTQGIKRKTEINLKEYGLSSPNGMQAKKSNKGKTEKKKETKLGIRAFLNLFRYADKKDIGLMTYGLLCAIINGATMPIMSIIFGRMTQFFLEFHPDQTPADSLQFSYGIPANTTSTLSPKTVGPSRLEFVQIISQSTTAYLILALVSLITSASQVFCWEKACENQIFKMRISYLKQILRLDIAWFDKNEDGDLSSKLTDDFERMKTGLGSKIPMVVQFISQFVTGLIVGFSISWRLTIVLCFAGPLLILVSAISGKNMAGVSKREQMRYGIAGGIASEVLTSIKTVVAFGGENFEIKRYDEAMEKGRKMAMSKYYIMAVTMSLSYALMYSVYALGFWYGSTLYLLDEIEPGQIFGVFFSVLVAAFAFGYSIPIVGEISQAIGSGSNVFEILDEVPEIDPYREGGLIMNKVVGAIEFKNVRFRYPTRPDVQVLQGLNLSIKSGHVVALVGSSGAGKSTIVGLLMRFYNPTEGQILIDGVSLDKYNLEWLRQQVGVVSQEPVLFGVSIEDNIRYGKQGVSKEDIVNAAKSANAHKFIMNLPNGYETQVGDLGTMLSGGQKQRIAIARALVKDPKILLLDEATSALDTESEGIVQAALENAMHGRTTIIIAHRLSTIRNVDIIYAMKDGEVFESGNHVNLMEKKGLYYNLVMMQEKKQKILPVTATLSDDENIPLPIRKRSSSARQSKRRRLSSVKTPSIHEEEADDSEEEVSYSEIFKLIKGQGPLILITIICCLSAGFLVPIFAVIYSEIIQVFLLTGDDFHGAVLFWTGMFCILSVSSGTIYFTAVLSSSISTEKMIQKVRTLVFTNILAQQVGWFDNEEYTPIILTNSMAKDPPLIKSVAGMRAGSILATSTTIISCIAITVYSNWKLGLIVCSFLPILLFSSWKQVIFTYRQYLREYTSLNDSAALASECIRNIRTVHLLGLQKYIINKYIEGLIPGHKSAVRQAIYFGIAFGLTQCMVFLVYATSFKIGSDYFLEGILPLSDLYRIGFALGFSFPSLGFGCYFLQDFIRSKASISFLFSLMRVKSDVNTFTKDGSKPGIIGKVEFKNVHFSYPSRPHVPILRGLNLTIKAGQTVALVGQSGCGKSTLISLLERFYSPSQGKIFVDDVNITNMNIAHLRGQMGLVTQEPVLFDCSIKENISYGAIGLEKEVTDQEIIDAAKTANIHEFIVQLPQGYDTMAGEKGTQLSGGQKQRIAIARAIIRNPKILLLDEATSALDNESEKIVQEALDKAREGRTSIVIAHRLSTIQDADLIVVVHEGKVTEEGTHEELKNRLGHYYDLIKIQDENNK